MKKVKEGLKNKGKSDDEVKEFEKAASALAPEIISKVGKGDFEYFIGESMDPDGMYVTDSAYLLLSTNFVGSFSLTIVRMESRLTSRYGHMV